MSIRSEARESVEYGNDNGGGEWAGEPGEEELARGGGAWKDISFVACKGGIWEEGLGELLGEEGGMSKAQMPTFGGSL